MNNINFYDPALRLRRDWLGPQATLWVSAGAAIAVVMAGFWMRYEVSALQAPASAAAAARQMQQDAIAAIEAQGNGKKADAALDRRLLGLQTTLAQRTEALKMLGQGGLRKDVGYSAAMLALARQSVDGLWLTGLAMDGSTLTLRGRTPQPELIAVYVGRLNGEAALRGRAFRALEIRRPADEAAAAASPGPAPQPSPQQSAARRLAPYVEFSLTGAHDDARNSASTVVAVATSDLAASRGNTP